jgi:hypothetical protein
LSFFVYKAIQANRSKTPALFSAPGVFFGAFFELFCRDDNDMPLTSKFLPQPKFARCLLVLGALVSLCGAARAQNLDEGKSAQRLFADGCVTCHKSPVGLAKGRIQLTLYSFLQDHYTTGNTEASALAGYLASLDTPPGRRSKSTKSTHRAPKPASPDKPN